MENNHEITEKILLLLSNKGIIKQEEVRNAVDYVLNDYEFKRKEYKLAIADSDLKIKAIKNFFIAKKVRKMDGLRKEEGATV